MADPWVAVVIEDDPAIREILEMVLNQNGFEVVLCEDGASGLAAVQAHRPLLTTCDIQMPGMDGFAVARRIRREHDTYLIMISALSAEIDVVQGLEAGADDYLVKPFSPRELRARVDAMLRRLDLGPPGGAAAAVATNAPGPGAASPRAGLAPPALPDGVRGTPLPSQLQPRHVPGEPPAPRPSPPPLPLTSTPPPTAASPHVDAGGESWLAHGDLSVHPATRTVLVDDRPVALTPTEFELLASLVRSGSRLRSRADLVLTMRGESHVTAYFVDDADKRAIEGLMESIRRKLADTAQVPRFIEDVRGVGYRMAQPH